MTRVAYFLLAVVLSAALLVAGTFFPDVADELRQLATLVFTGLGIQLPIKGRNSESLL